MGRSASLTKAKIRRAVEIVREIDPRAVIEVKPDGTIRILPPESTPMAKTATDAVEEWFSHGED